MKYVLPVAYTPGGTPLPQNSLAVVPVESEFTSVVIAYTSQEAATFNLVVGVYNQGEPNGPQETAAGAFAATNDTVFAVNYNLPTAPNGIATLVIPVSQPTAKYAAGDFLGLYAPNNELSVLSVQILAKEVS